MIHDACTRAVSPCFRFCNASADRQNGRIQFLSKCIAAIIIFRQWSVTERVLPVTRGARLSRVCVLLTGSYGDPIWLQAAFYPSRGYVWSWLIRFVRLCTPVYTFVPIGHLIWESTCGVMHIEILISSVIYSVLCLRLGRGMPVMRAVKYSVYVDEKKTMGAGHIFLYTEFCSNPRFFSPSPRLLSSIWNWFMVDSMLLTVGN